jgi:dTDP-4-amino-4,6-dideoxygalactose transaminase
MEQKQAKDACLKLLRQYTKHECIKITNSGDAAIFAALSIAKQKGYKKVIIPDQGGWLTYKTFPKLLDLEIEEIKTNYGRIDPQSLTEYKDAVLLYSSFAAYAADQPIGPIHFIAKKQNMFIILDASGALAHRDPVSEGRESLCDGRWADIIMGSFGKWKIADLGYGGFLSTKEISKEVKESDIFKLTKCHTMNYDVLLEKLKAAPKRIQFLMGKALDIKRQWEGFNFIHEDANGVNVIIKYNNEEEKERIIAKCKENNLKYKLCPLYIKVLEKAISIEVKRLQE